MQLLEHFKDLTVHPKNAEELKGLILQLAVQGKLTKNWREKNPDVEPASVLLEKITVEKKRLIKEKKISKEKQFTVIDLHNVRYKIPKNWIWTNLGEVTILISGRDLTPYEYSDSELAYPYLTGASQIKNSEIVLSRWTEKPKVLSQLGDLLISCKGTIGKTVINRIGEIHIARQIMSLRTYSWIDVDYTKLFADSYVIDLQEISNGIIPGISREHLLYAEFPLPPFEEQEAIVRTVNQLFKEVEELEQQTTTRIKLKEDFVTSALQKLDTGDTATEWAFLQDHFKTFFTEKTAVKKLRESILQLAVQGKLTTHWRLENPDVEPAAVLLERIKAEKTQLVKEKKIKKEKPLPEIMEDEIPYELPQGWVWCRFQEIFDIRDGTHDSPKDSNESKTYPLVTSKDFKDGVIDFDSARRISEADYLKVIKRSQVHEGDILFSMIGGNIGNQVEVGELTEFAIKNVALFKHYKYGLPSPGFLKLFSQFIAMSLQSEAAGGAQPFVSLKFFRNIVVGLPPKDEQKSIISKVNALLGLCDKLENEIDQNSKHIEQLMQSCLREVSEEKSGADV